MAATPPRPGSPDQYTIPSHALQISPNLEALLEHDELIRRNSSPTTAVRPEFPIGSLPPPPPRKAHAARKQDLPSTRSKEGQRWKSFGLDTLPDDSAPSRPATPNPYLNPAPVLLTQPHPDIELTPGKMCPVDRPLNKVEKILWMGRDSLSLFSGCSGSKRSAEYDPDAVQANRTLTDPAPADRQIRQAPSDSEIATLSSTLGSPYLHALQHKPSSIRSSSESHQRASHLLPRLSLPSMSFHSPQPQSVTSDDYLSFIDFFSPSASDESNFYNIHDKSPCQPHSISTPSSALYSATHNHSSTSLASMRFAPPSPTSLAVQQLSPSDSSSSVALSTMVFATPSPSAEHAAPPWLPTFSDPPSPYSPLEFAPPGSPQDLLDTPFLHTTALPCERGRKMKTGKRSLSLSPHPFHRDLLPPTTNQLDPNQRADRIRRNRKLARVFGMVPGTDESATDTDVPGVSKKSRSPSLAAFLSKQKTHRHAVSVSVSVKSPGMKTESSTPCLWSPDGRRHSIPLTTGSFTLYVDDEQDLKPAKPRPRHGISDSLETASTRSFIDLSDEDACEDDDVSGLSFLAPYPLRHRRLHQSTSTPSLVESLDSEAQAEVDKRRKREKVARLHRFLGSRVPPEAIIGNVYGPPLPPAAIPEEPDHERRRRVHNIAPLDAFDRVKEELDEQEKALNVRRAQKMERVFGTPPPQMLFHTRPSRPTVPVSPPMSPIHPYALSIDIPSSRNPNQSAYVHKSVHRRGPSDSSRSLLPRIEDTPQPSPSSFAQSFAESLSGYQQVLAQSSVYLNYQHSLNSLVDIIDRDDRKSLVELHCLLHGGADESPSDGDETTVNSRRVSMSSSFKSERRRSLPSKSSITSLSSEMQGTPKASPFQIRRRKAAKLTHFFGVDYRELIQDILESIEKGVEEERTQGTLQPEEVEVLMHRVRSLRTIKDPLP